MAGLYLPQMPCFRQLDLIKVYNDSEGAAWDTDPTWPWFAPTATGSCNVSYDNRVDCNPGDGNQQDCLNKGCCFDATV